MVAAVTEAREVVEVEASLGTRREGKRRKDARLVVVNDEKLMNPSTGV